MKVAGIGCSVRSVTSMAMVPMLAGIVTQVLVVVHSKLILCLQHRITPRQVQVHHSTLRSLQHRIMVLSTGLGLQRLNYTSGSWYGLAGRPASSPFLGRPRWLFEPATVGGAGWPTGPILFFYVLKIKYIFSYFFNIFLTFWWAGQPAHPKNKARCILRLVFASRAGAGRPILTPLWSAASLEWSSIVGPLSGSAHTRWVIHLIFLIGILLTILHGTHCHIHLLPMAHKSDPMQ